MAAIHFDITGDNKQVLQSLKQTMEAITKLENKTLDADKNVSKGFSNMGKSISSELGGMLTRFLSITAAVGAFTSAIRKAYQVNRDFERKNSELASVLGTTRQGIIELSDSAQSLGRTTEFTSTEVTELQIALSRLGFQKGQILEMQGTVLKFAAAVNTDLGRAANFAGAALRGFGLEAKDTSHLLDVMAAATTKSALDFSKLETSMSIVAPIAHAFGLSVEDAVTLLGALSNAGFDASSAATATRNILLNLADANGKLAKGLGHTARTFPEIIAALKECQAKGMDLNSTLEMTDKRSVSAFNALISGAASADELREALGNVDGTLNDMYKTMTENVAGGIKQVQSAWEGLLLTMQNSTGPIANILKGFARGLNVITDLIQGDSMREIRTKQKVDVIKDQNYSDDYYEKTISQLENKIKYIDYKKIGEGNKQKKKDEENLKAWRRAYLEIRQDRALASLEASMNEAGGGGNNNNKHNLTDEEKKDLKRKAEQRKQAERQLQEELTALTLSNEQERLNLMEDGTRKEIEQIRLNYRKREEEIRTLEKKWQDENVKAGRTNLSANGLTAEQNAAINAARESNSLTQERAIEEKARQNRERYLKDYGTYEEKKRAINEEYMRKMLATTDEYEKKRIDKERIKELESLREQYDATYSLIFADADYLSDTLLSRAIEATQKEIEKAENSGDIQELTALYERLRSQLEEKSNRSGWGFIGLAEAFKDIEGARKDAENATDPQKRKNALAMEQIALENIKKRASEVESVFSEIGNTLEGMGGTLGEIGSGIRSLGAAAGGVMETIAQVRSGKEFDLGGSIASVFTGAVQLGAMVASSIKANKDAQKEWNRELEQSTHNLAMLNLEALDYKQRNIFGVENPYKKAIDGAIQYGEAMAKLQEQSAKLAGGKVQTGTRKGINWANVGKGAAIGASAGAVAGAGIFSGLGATAGAAIGAGVGLITGLLSTKVVPVFENLTSKYGTIVNDDFTLNPELLADYDKLDDDTKKLVDNWKEIKAKAEEAEQQMRDTFTSLSGDIGGQLSDSLVEAFRNGRLDSAIDSFHDKMTGTIEDIVERMVFSNIFSDMFDKLQKDMESSFGAGGDNNIVDDLMSFEEAYQSGLEEYGKQMDAAREYLQSKGYDAWGGSSNVEASSKGFAAMSQDTGDELNGRFTALQISNETIAQNSLVQSGYLLSIKDLMSGSGSVLTDIRDMHAIEASYLEDIAKHTKPIPVMVETLDKIQRNTAKL